ncbi:MAG: proline racemase [Chloroflexota bacterium]|jgi:proline racemase|nr:proline racemase [Chloroflexota bacterium]
MGEHDIPLQVTTVDYHAGGEPFRIVTGGVRPLEGRTILERRRFAREVLDRVRHLVVDEPRGHADMYGCFVTEPDDAAADLGVVFFHNEGYSTACGHGTIALVTWAIESGRIPTRAPEEEILVDVPSGRLACLVRMDPDGVHVASVRFRNVPAFVLARDVPIATSAGIVSCAVAYGGAFYASVDVRALGLDVSPARLTRLIALQRELRPGLDAALDVVHPEEPELRGIYGVIYWQDEPTSEADRAAGVALTQRNVTVFADGEVDRSPCGSGTSARLALLAAEGRLGPDGRGALRHLSVVDSAFLGRAVAETDVAGRPAVVTTVEGSAYLTGRHDFTLDPRDPLGTGFLLR